MSNKRMLDIDRSTSTAHRLTEYDGVCNNIHGHNLKWTGTVRVIMDDTGLDNMPVDFKRVKDTIDRVDHTLLLSAEDRLVKGMYDLDDFDSHGTSYEFLRVENPSFGEIVMFDGDPTCEMLVGWMGELIYNLDEAIKSVRIELGETDKYQVSSVVVEEYDVEG